MSKKTNTKTAFEKLERHAAGLDQLLTQMTQVVIALLHDRGGSFTANLEYLERLDVERLIPSVAASTVDGDSLRLTLAPCPSCGHSSCTGCA